MANVSSRSRDTSIPAPVFSSKLSGGYRSTSCAISDYWITLTVTHHSNVFGKPVTFRINDCLLDHWPLVRLDEDGSYPIEADDELPCYFRAVEDNVGECFTYASLAPGESHTIEIRLLGLWEDFEGVPKVGERYSLWHSARDISWWDWGTKEEHKGTMIPWYEDSHDVRPRIHLPDTNALEFTVIEES